MFAADTRLELAQAGLVDHPGYRQRRATGLERLDPAENAGGFRALGSTRPSILAPTEEPMRIVKHMCFCISCRGLMSSEGERVVQTTLDQREYERFRRIAEEAGLSLKEALRRAANSYAEAHEQVDPDDPLFTAVESLEEDVGETTSAREMDADLYGRRDE